MARSAPLSGARAVVKVDLSAFTKPDTCSDAERLEAAKALVDACHTYGFVKIAGHGIANEQIQEAFAWTKKLFDLPLEDKMKAPHPPTATPHRGYSGFAQEKVYSKAEVKAHADGGGDIREELRKIADFKESYEIGSEEDDKQPNIWLPEDVFPGFRGYYNSLYERLAETGKVVLAAIGLGLGLNAEEQAVLMQLDSPQYSQLRLLHYPSLSKEKIHNEVFARLPAHTDWGTFTMLFQDDRGGLELCDPHSQEYIFAVPEEGTLVLNVGDVLQRFTNDYFLSAVHRVSVPVPSSVPESGIPPRYSIPFFVSPAPSQTVETLSKYITTDQPLKYDPLTFQEYSDITSKYQYQEAEA